MENLWHLFPVEELYKLKTFLAGGLWCADLGSIIGFGDDSEGTGLHGTFVSCWHAAEADPTDVAWEIFGGAGNGFAIGTTMESLASIATRSTKAGVKAQVCKVSYLPGGTFLSEPACQVLDQHEREAEVRFVLNFENKGCGEFALREQIRSVASAVCNGRDHQTPIHSLTVSESDRGDSSDLALIVPIDPCFLFKQFLVGANVHPHECSQALRLLEQARIPVLPRHQEQD